MKKPLKIFTIAACIWSVYMLVLFIFLSMCVELQWTFIYSLPTALDWMLRNVFVLLFQAGSFGVPLLTAVTVILTVLVCVKEKNTKSVDLPVIGTTVAFAITASIIAAIDTSIISTFS